MWRLVVRVGGTTQTLPIAAQATPFDVDLGDDGRGHLVASYSRCSAPAHNGELPHGCRLYYYDFTSGRERPLSFANLAGASQFDPSMAAGRVAFARIDDRRAVGASNHAQIFVQNLAGGPPRRLAGGLQGDAPATGPSSLDLSANALAFAWSAANAVALEPYFSTSEVLVDQLFGPQIVIARAYEEQEDPVLSPSIWGGTVYYGVAGDGEEPQYQLLSMTIRGAHPGVAGAPPNFASTATAAAGTIYSRCSVTAFGFPSGPPCEVALAEHVTYTDPDRALVHVARPTTISLSPQESIENSPARTPGNWLAWSAYDPASREYRLMLRRPSGAVSAAPVPPRRTPFDVELGPRAGGGLIAVYSRCAVEPKLDPADGLPLPSTARGCGLYRYDIGSAGEHAIRGAGSRFLPGVWNDELAYAALGHDGRPALYLGSLSGRRAPRLLSVGPAGLGTVGLGPRALTLREGRVAYVWEYRTASGLRSELRLDEHDAPSRLLGAVVSPSGSARELSPVFTGGVLAWAGHEAGGHSWVATFGLASRQISSFLAPDPIEAFATNHFVIFHAEESGEAFYAQGEGRAGVSIRFLIGRHLGSLTVK